MATVHGMPCSSAASNPAAIKCSDPNSGSGSLITASITRRPTLITSASLESIRCRHLLRRFRFCARTLECGLYSNLGFGFGFSETYDRKIGPLIER